MKVLNLVNKESSDIKYEIYKYPDGQQQVKIEFFRIDPYFAKTGPYSVAAIPGDDNIQIKSRLNSWLDLERIVCTTQSLKQMGYNNLHLYVPYFLGSRSDRQFDSGENNYLKHVICPIINLQGFKSVTVLDPHSTCLEMGLNEFKKVSNMNLVDWALTQIYDNNKVVPDWSSKCLLLSPDEGATHKIYKLAEQIGYKGDIITCSKERDKDGKLTKCVVPHDWDHDKDVIIIDDICDGGNTFINIAKIVTSYRHSTLKGKIYLIVTHGIFSKGFRELYDYFDGIYCTNSYSDLKDNLDNPTWVGNPSKLVKQLNIF